MGFGFVAATSLLLWLAADPGPLRIYMIGLLRRGYGGALNPLDSTVALLLLVAGVAGAAWLAIVAQGRIPALTAGFALSPLAIAIALSYAVRVPQGHPAIPPSYLAQQIVPGHDVLWPVAALGLVAAGVGLTILVALARRRWPMTIAFGVIGAGVLIVAGVLMTIYGFSWRDSLELLDSAYG